MRGQGREKPHPPEFPHSADRPRYCYYLMSIQLCCKVGVFRKGKGHLQAAAWPERLSQSQVPRGGKFLDSTGRQTFSHTNQEKKKTTFAHPFIPYIPMQSPTMALVAGLPPALNGDFARQINEAVSLLIGFARTPAHRLRLEHGTCQQASKV